MNEVVKIRGLKTGLQILFDKNATFEDVKSTLLEKLERGNKFFIRGTTAFIDKNNFSREQIEELRRMFHRHGMLFSEKVPTATPNFEPHPAPIQVPLPPPMPAIKVEKAQPTVVIDRTLRGGQEVRTESSVLVLGNLNPGAQIIAGGSIDIRGICRGTVHAGAFGDQNAWIIADKLRPMQIRIADLIARPPDDVKNAEEAERASIKNGYIVFEPIMR